MRRLLLSLALPVVLLAAMATPTQAAPQQAIAVVGTLGPSWNLPTVLKDWSESPYVELVRRPSCAGFARCITICPEQRFPDGRWGQAWIGWSADRRTQRAVVWVSPDVPGVYFRKGVVCHEVGHTLTNETHPDLGCMGEVASPDRRWPGTRNLLRAR